jgi:hypothetical protein
LTTVNVRYAPKASADAYGSDLSEGPTGDISPLMSTPEQKCIGWPEQKYISDASRKAPETGVFCSGIRLGSDYLPTYPS